MARTVVVTGIGAVTALGSGATALHERWAAGVVGIEDGQGAARDFVPGDHLSVKEVRRLDRFAQFAVVAADEAIAQSGLAQAGYDPFRVGCIIATGVGGIDTLERNLIVFKDRGARMISPLGVPGYMPNAAAAAISMRHTLRGQSFSVVSACASGAHAIGVAARMIAHGDADAMVVGGSEAALTEFSHGCFASMQALSPSGISRPFDARRDGFVMGEGAGVLVLESAEAAAARGAVTLAELAGYASTSDAHHLTAPEPEGLPAAKAIELALADAGAAAGDVAYVNAHGTSTELNDLSETRALKRALGPVAASVPVSSTKSSIGHLLGAAGAVEAVATIRTLITGVVPPTLGLEMPDPELDLDYVPDAARQLEFAPGAIAISNSFAFGGHNVTLVLRKAA